MLRFQLIFKAGITVRLDDNDNTRNGGENDPNGLGIPSSIVINSKHYSTTFNESDVDKEVTFNFYLNKSFPLETSLNYRLINGHALSGEDYKKSIRNSYF